MPLPFTVVAARKWHWMLSVGSFLLLWQTQSFAETQWSVASECGSREQFEQAIRARVGSDADALLAQTSLELRKSSDAYALSVRVGDQQREIYDRNCQDLFRAGIVVAIAFHNGDKDVQPLPVVPQPSQTAGTTSKPAPATTTNTATPNQALPHPPATPPPTAATVVPPADLPAKSEPGSQPFRLGARVGVIAGRVPQIRPVFGPTFSYETRRMGFEWSGRFIPSSEIRDAAGKGVRVYGLGMALNALYSVDRAFGVQAGVFAYRLTAHGLGVVDSATSSIVAIGPQIGLWVMPVDLRWFYTRLGADVEFNLLRSRFEVLEYTSVFESSRVALQGSIAAGYKF